MRAFRWFPIVAVVVAIGMADRTACAQVADPAGAATAPNTAGVPANPLPVAVPPAPGTQVAASAPAPCPLCCDGAAWHVFGDYLLLRPRNAGVEYAVPINGPIVGNQVPIQIGPTAVVDPEFQSGFRVGFERILNECSSVSLTYTYYRNDADDGPVTAPTPYVLRPMVFNPSTADAATDYSSASAHESISFNLVDLDYHHNLWSCDCSSINYLIGARYAQLTQQFDADFQSIITASANTNVEFDGFGLRLGVDGERMICNGFFCTAKFDANLLGGQFGVSYLQSNTNNPIVDTTTWHDAALLRHPRSRGRRRLAIVRRARPRLRRLPDQRLVERGQAVRLHLVHAGQPIQRGEPGRQHVVGLRRPDCPHRAGVVGAVTTQWHESFRSPCHGPT